jgi:hypothetical protein
MSLSIGHRGLWHTISSNGHRRATVGLPRSGLHYTKTYPPTAHPHVRPRIEPHGTAPPPTRAEQATFLIVIMVMVALMVLADAIAPH